MKLSQLNEGIVKLTPNQMKFIMNSMADVHISYVYHHKKSFDNYINESKPTTKSYPLSVAKALEKKGYVDVVTTSGRINSNRNDFTYTKKGLQLLKDLVKTKEYMDIKLGERPMSVDVDEWLMKLNDSEKQYI